MNSCCASQATLHGGAVALLTARAWFSNDNLARNKAGQDGGAVLVNNTRADIENYVRFYLTTLQDNLVGASKIGLNQQTSVC